jgi:hypothetical protein
VVCPQEEPLRDPQPKSPGCFEIDDQFKFGRLLDRKIRGLGAPENPVDKSCGLSIDLGHVRSVGEKASRFDERTLGRGGRQPVVEGQLGDSLPVRDKYGGPEARARR